MFTIKKRNWLHRLGMIILLWCALSCSWENEYKKSAKRSIQSETDLILVPFPFYIFDKESRQAITLSHYSKDELKNIMDEHDISTEGLESDWVWDEKNQHLEREVNYTSHYTNYSYDANIPIWIYGAAWLNNGEYPDNIYQQHIPSLFAKILKFNFINKLPISAYNKIFRKTAAVPEIIVTIVVDQGGQQLYHAHPNAFPFLKDLRTKSAYFTNARVGHLEAHTAVGHAAIGTGSFPSEMKTFSNEIYRWENGEVVSRAVYEGENSHLNLNEMATLTLADEWDRVNKNLPIIISQCYAARASIGMAGHGLLIPTKYLNSNIADKDFVYWENSKSLNWDTYRDAYDIPSIIKNRNFYSFYKSNEDLQNSLFKAESEFDFKKKIHSFQASSYQVRMDGEVFLNVIDSEIISKNKHLDGKTDLAYLTLKASDAVGHMYGWESRESEKILSDTDREIERIFNFLQDKFKDKFILLITADHGAAPMPEISKSPFLTHDIFFNSLSTLLPEEVRNEKSVIKWVTHSQLSLDHGIMKKYHISVDQVIHKIKEIEIKGKPFFRRVWKIEDLN